MFTWLSKYFDVIIIRGHKVEIPVEIFRYTFLVVCFTGMFLLEESIYSYGLFIILALGYPVRVLKASEASIRLYTRIFFWRRNIVEVNSDLPEIAIEQGDDLYYYIILQDRDRRFILDKTPTLDKSRERFEKIMKVSSVKIIKNETHQRPASYTE